MLNIDKDFSSTEGFRTQYKRRNFFAPFVLYIIQSAFGIISCVLNGHSDNIEYILRIVLVNGVNFGKGELPLHRLKKSFGDKSK